MKKFSALLCVALLITFGGVYAAWTYQSGNAQAVSSPIQSEMTVNLDSETSYGTLAITTNTAKIAIDDEKAGAGTGDHIATTADLTASGSIIVKFTANPNAIDKVINNGVSLKFTLTCNAKYNETTIFTIGSNDLTPAGSGSAGVFTYTIDFEDFNISIAPVGGISLPTPSAANNFIAALTAEPFSLTVTDVTNIV